MPARGRPSGHPAFPQAGPGLKHSGKPTLPLRTAPRLQWRSWVRLLPVLLLLLPALPVPAQQPLDLQITIYSYGGSQPDVMAVASGTFWP